MNNQGNSNDHLENALKDAPVFSMPKGLDEKIMARVTAEMDKDSRAQKRPVFSPLKIAAAVLALAVAAGVMIYTQQPEPGAESTIAGVPNEVENTHQGTAVLPDEIPAVEIIPVALDDTATTGTNNGSAVSVEPTDAMLISQAGYSDYLGAIGTDPLASDELDSDPVMMLVGF